MNIYKPTTQFNFENISLDDPGRLQGGAYYSKIKYNKEDSIFIETPKCSTKKGIVVTGKKTYCDLVYTTNEHDMINWIIEFEQTIKKLLFNKSELWFHNELDLDDIEYFFNSSIRTYKENQQIMRTYISSKHFNNTSVQIYDENESIKNFKDVLNKSIKAIICFKGVKFTSTSFQLDIDIKQILIIEHKPIFNKCMISNVPNTLEIVNNINTTPNNNIYTSHTNKNIDYDNITDGNTDEPTTEKNDDTTFENDAHTSETDANTTIENDEHTSETDANTTIENDAHTSETDVNTTIENDAHTSETDVNTTIENDAHTSETDANTTIENDAHTSEPDANTTIEYDAHTSETDAKTTIENDAYTSETDAEISVKNEDDITEPITNTSINITKKLHKHTTDHNKKLLSSLGNNTSTININTPKTNNDFSDIHSLEEYDIHINNENSITLKRPNEVFYDIYKESLRKAKIAKNAAIAAYLEAKHIKQTYLLDEFNDYSDEDDLTELDDLSEISEDEKTHNL
jgi:hypothetical protein